MDGGSGDALGLIEDIGDEPRSGEQNGKCGGTFWQAARFHGAILSHGDVRYNAGHETHTLDPEHGRGGRVGRRHS